MTREQQMIQRNMAAAQRAISEAGEPWNMGDAIAEQLNAELCQARIDGVAVADRNCLLSAKLEAVERRCEELEQSRANIIQHWHDAKARIVQLENQLSAKNFSTEGKADANPEKANPQ